MGVKGWSASPAIVDVEVKPRVETGGGVVKDDVCAVVGE